MTATGKPRILIVEDEAIVARDISQQLVELGYEPVGHATRGEDAIMLAGELLPDLVLMDIQLAGKINGIVAAGAIRNHFALPVVFITAFAADDMLAQAKLTEPFGYVLKPFSSRELRVVMEMALYKYQVEAALLEESRHNQAILDNMIDGVITFDNEARIQTFNPAACNIFGYSVADVIGHNISLLIPEATTSSLSTDLRMYQQMSALRIKGFPNELTGQRQNGSQFSLRLSLSQVDRGGKTTFIGLVSDICRGPETRSELPSDESLPSNLQVKLQQLMHHTNELAATPLSAKQIRQLDEIAHLGASLLAQLETNKA